jgi:hypothetical protein
MRPLPGERRPAPTALRKQNSSARPIQCARHHTKLLRIGERTRRVFSGSPPWVADNAAGKVADNAAVAGAANPLALCARQNQSWQ